ncbi:PIN domain-containing protein [Candidatus Saccharibacteria bacterium]|nr:PIN domain-containing protein [Candidatus Saccharibacteria bacterium]
MESRIKDVEMLDTCVVLRMILRDVPEQAKRAVKILSRKGKRFYISEMVIYEAAYVMEKRMEMPREYIVDSLKDFLSGENICNGVGIFSGVFQMYLEHPKLSFADCYLAVQAGSQGTTPLWTFDRKLAGQTEEGELA